MIEDAKSRQLWCPMVRMEQQRSTGCSAVNDPKIYSANCIGSCCAMWRWMPGKVKKVLQIVPNDAGGGDEVYVDVPQPPTHGYCGLAGRPEVMP